MNQPPTMAAKVERYLTHRSDLGYQLSSEILLLRQFGAYADQANHQGPLTVDLALRWARLPATQDPLYWARRLEIVRGLARYLALFEAGTEIPEQRLLGPAHRRNVPHVYSEAEISGLIAAGKRLPPTHGLRPRTYATLIGLLACTGLRISEALQLTRSNFDSHQSVLTIRNTKFGKSRLVPLHPSATAALLAYALDRDRLVPALPTDRFFVTDRGTPLCCSTVHWVFRQLCDGLPIVGRGARRRPRLHDLRHTFACRRVQSWYDTGADVSHAVQTLSVYLGHVKVSDTYWYLTATPDLLAQAAARFEPFAGRPSQEGQP
jgi:integrase